MQPSSHGALREINEYKLLKSHLSFLTLSLAKFIYHSINDGPRHVTPQISTLVSHHLFVTIQLMNICPYLMRRISTQYLPRTFKAPLSISRREYVRQISTSRSMLECSNLFGYTSGRWMFVHPHYHLPDLMTDDSNQLK